MYTMGIDRGFILHHWGWFRSQTQGSCRRPCKSPSRPAQRTQPLPRTSSGTHQCLSGVLICPGTLRSFSSGNWAPPFCVVFLRPSLSRGSRRAGIQPCDKQPELCRQTQSPPSYLPRHIMSLQCWGQCVRNSPGLALWEWGSWLGLSHQYSFDWWYSFACREARHHFKLHILRWWYLQQCP